MSRELIIRGPKGPESDDWMPAAAFAPGCRWVSFPDGRESFVDASGRCLVAWMPAVVDERRHEEWSDVLIGVGYEEVGRAMADVVAARIGATVEEWV